MMREIGSQGRKREAKGRKGKRSEHGREILVLIESSGWAMVVRLSKPPATQFISLSTRTRDYSVLRRDMQGK